MEEQFSESGGSRVNFFSRYQKTLWISLVSLVILTAGLLTYLFFFRNLPNKPMYEGDVEVAVRAPSQSAARSELSYEITVKNKSNSKLERMSLEVFYPKDFTFTNSTLVSSDSAGRIYSLPDLPKGGEQSLVIIGRLEGNLQEIKVLNLKLRYVPENFRSEFVATAGATTEILAPNLSLRLFSPPRLVSGQTVEYEVEVTNISQSPFSNLILEMTYPEHFEFRDANPDPSLEQNNKWQIASLGIGESKTFKIYGKIFEEPRKESFAQASLSMLGENGEFFSAGRSFAFTSIESSPLVVSHKIANLSSPETLLSGQMLDFELEYENVGQVGLNNVVITFVSETPVLDLARLSGTKGELKDSSLIWIPATNPELLVVPPGGKGKFSFSVPISNKLVQNLQKNPELKTWVEFFSKEYHEPIVGNVLNKKIQTEMTLSAKATQVSLNTYQIELVVTNSVNDLKDTEVTAIVPGLSANLLLDSINPPSEQGKVDFVPTAGILKWRAGDIFAFSGTFHDSRSLSFNLVSTGPVLLQDIEASGIDQFTGKKVISNKLESLPR